jgi:heme exporter protein C
MHRFANPARFLRLADAILPWCAGATAILLVAGLYLGLFVAPPDYQQGESVRIMYVHVPAAWMAMFVYGCLALTSAVALIWRHPLADLVAQAAAPIGASFTFIALVTGSLWGKPMWGAWWVWDARLTSVLVLFFLYLGHIALAHGFDDPPSWRWSDSSMCRSSSSRSTGGRPCTSRPACCGWAGRRSIRRCCGHCC